MSGSAARAVLPGIPACGGVAVGPVAVLDRPGRAIPRSRVTAAKVPEEIDRLRAAIESSRLEIDALREGLGPEHPHDYGLILDAHLLMHRDELLVDAAIARIRDDGINAEWALRRTVSALGARLRGVGNAYFRERAVDVEHVAEHITRHLTGDVEALPVLAEPSVLVAEDLTPADAARLLGSDVLGIVTVLGTATSHTAILARALEIPSLVGVTDALAAVEVGDVVVVDGLRGRLVARPDPEERAEAEARGARFRRFTGRLAEHADELAETRDGQRVRLLANLELPAEAALARAHGAEGVGLYRTEFLFLDRDAPTEEEQLAVYRDVVREMAPRAVVLRTFDLGGDKLGRAGVARPREPNPALGLRAIRLALARPELFRAQVRAVLRAAADGPVELLLPLVSGVGELREARARIESHALELEREGVPFSRVPIGIMVEVPAAALMAEALARECDFFSVGTNDLVQYTLALDRTNPEVAHLAESCDPAVLRLLRETASAAAAHDLPLAMCGDMAADPVAIPLVVGLGFRRLSVPVASLSLVRAVLAAVGSTEARDAAEIAVGLPDAAAVRALLVERFGEALAEIWEERGVGVRLARPGRGSM